MKLLIKLFSHVIILIPRQLWRWVVGGFVGFLWYDILKIRKQDMIDNLGIAFPNLTQEQKEKMARKSIYNLSFNFAEIFRLPAINKKWIDQNVIFEGWPHVEEALHQKKGILFLALHMGNGDISASAIVTKGLPLYLITKRFKIKWLDELWFFIRGSNSVNYINAHGENTSFEILKALKMNASVVFVIDQFMGPPYGINTTFFGKETGTAYGLALFYLKTKAPVIPVYSYEGPEGKIHLCFEPIMELQTKIKGDKEKDVKSLTQLFNYKLEDIIKRYPEEWLWLHRRWKEYRVE